MNDEINHRDASRWVEEHGDALYRYALLRVSNADLAGDLVQDTFLSALKGIEGFRGGSSVRTWLIGILKHKIIDQVRRQLREQPLLQSGDDDRTEAEVVDALFKPDGHWQSFPASWGDPDNALENKEFWETFEICSKLMPAKTARVFMMREVMELTTDEICKELNITATNCWVMLHRARLSLRECLQTKWFGKP